MANNPYVNKVQTADGSTLMDITDTTAQTGDVLEGQVFYAASGQRSTGTLGDFTGATASADGTHGLVPAPESGDQVKFLRGDGTWADTGSTAVIEYDVDIAVSSWVSPAPYTYTWSNATIVESTLVDVFYKTGVRGILHGDIDVAKQTGAIVFTVPEKPTNTLSLIVRLIQNTAVTTIYPASQTTAGLMSAADKTKLDGVETGATANVVSDSLSDTSTTNALSAAKGKELNDAVSAKYTKPATGIPATDIADGVIPVYDIATTSSSGLMSSTDKTKLDGVETGATANVVSDSLSDTSTTNALSAAKGKELNDAVSAKYTKPVTGIPATDIADGVIPAYDIATTSSSGLMSSTDKTKLDGVETGANKTTVSNSLSDTSTTNALSAAQGKTLNDQIANKVLYYKSATQTATINAGANTYWAFSDLDLVPPANYALFSVVYVITGEASTSEPEIHLQGLNGQTAASYWAIAVKNNGSASRTWTVRIICWYVRADMMAELPST